MVTLYVKLEKKMQLFVLHRNFRSLVLTIEVQKHYTAPNMAINYNTVCRNHKIISKEQRAKQKQRGRQRWRNQGRNENKIIKTCQS